MLTPKLDLEPRCPFSQSAPFPVPIAFIFSTKMESGSCKSQLKQFSTKVVSHTCFTMVSEEM